MALEEKPLGQCYAKEWEPYVDAYLSPISSHVTESCWIAFMIEIPIMIE